MVLYEIFSDYWRESRPRVCWRSRSNVRNFQRLLERK